MTSFAARFGMTGIHEEAIGPGLETVAVAQVRQLPPDGHECVLQNVLGEAQIEQVVARLVEMGMDVLVASTGSDEGPAGQPRSRSRISSWSSPLLANTVLP